MSKLNIAILGCTGHVGKNLMYYFGREETFELFLFSLELQKDEGQHNGIINCTPCIKILLISRVSSLRVQNI